MRHGAGVQRLVTTVDGSTMVLSVPGWLDPQRGQQEEEELMALLGADGAQQLRTAIQELPARRLTAQLAGALYATPALLTPDQVGQLVQAIAGSPAPRGSTSSQFDWTALLEKAHGILSDQQLAMLTGMQVQEQYQQALNAALHRANQTQQSANPSAAAGK